MGGFMLRGSHINDIMPVIIVTTHCIHTLSPGPDPRALKTMEGKRNLGQYYHTMASSYVLPSNLEN